MNSGMSNGASVRWSSSDWTGYSRRVTQMWLCDSYLHFLGDKNCIQLYLLHYWIDVVFKAHAFRSLMFRHSASHICRRSCRSITANNALWVVTRLQAGRPVFVSRQGQRICHHFLAGSGTPQPRIQRMHSQTFFSRGQNGREADRSRACSTEGKIAWIYTFTPPYVF
jgi:hypothetical protein